MIEISSQINGATAGATARRTLRITSDEIAFARKKRQERMSWDAISKMLLRPAQALRDTVADVETTAFLHHVDNLVHMTSKERTRMLLAQCLEALT